MRRILPQIDGAVSVVILFIDSQMKKSYYPICDCFLYEDIGLLSIRNLYEFCLFSERLEEIQNGAGPLGSEAGDDNFGHRLVIMIDLTTTLSGSVLRLFCLHV